MQLARVIGEVVATMKDANLVGMQAARPAAHRAPPARRPAARSSRSIRSAPASASTSSSCAAARRRFRSIQPSRQPTPRSSASSITGMPMDGPVTQRSDADLREVVGTVVSTQKNRKLEGAKLLLVQPLTLDGEAARRRAARDRFGRRRRRRDGARRDRGQSGGGCARRRRRRSTPRSSASSTALM